MIDNRIIQKHGPHSVLAETWTVKWPAGGTIGLHRVRLRDRDERYLRALRYDTLLWLVVDVRDLAPELATEIPRLPWADTDSLVGITLRQTYAGLDALRARAVTRFKAAWVDMPGTPGPRLPRVPAGWSLDAACWQRSGAAAGVVA